MRRKSLHFVGRLQWLFAVITFVLLAFVVWVSRDLPTADTFAARTIAQSTRIYDRSGTVLLYDLHGNEKRTIVKLADISPALVHATIVAEDDQFYHHIGLDVPGILRSTFTNVKKQRIAQGGSTITQQLVRNAVLTQEKTFARKIREAILALEIEARFSKEEILEAYLNQIPYGSLVYGAEAAAQTYFGKPARDLSVAEAAVLAALPKAPSYYSPHGAHRDELLERQKYILNRMVELGYVDAQEAEKAKTETLSFRPPKENIRAPHFVFFVQEELERRFGKERVEQGGLVVTTTLNASFQEIAERLVRQGAEKNERQWKGRNAALTAIHPKTGEILAVVGSRDYFNPAYDGNVNVAIRPRQPGSSFKPVVYATAFSKGLTPDTILFDVPTEFSTGSSPYRPHNYTGQTYGPVTARQALANSLNIASVKMLWLAGVRDTVALAQNLGVTTLTDPDAYGLSLVLGGGAVTLLEETAAFGVFAADGERAPVQALLRVQDQSGSVLFEHRAETSTVLDREVARNITDILSDNEARSLVFGASTPLVLGSRPVAAKTGTAQDFRDAWTLGYTPSLVVGVWAGNNDYSPMRKGADGSVVAAPIWNAFMREALANTPIERFPKPKPIVTKKPILNGVWAVEETVAIDRASGKRATDLTPTEWREERTYRTVHDTLFWVDKRNPRGPQPLNPEHDPQFLLWEDALHAWLATKPELLASVTEKPPEAFDDIHTEETRPTIAILAPRDFATISTTSFSVQASLAAAFAVTTVLVLIDDTPYGTATKSPMSGLYEKTVTLSDDQQNHQEHTLTIRAFDQYGNRGEASISFRLNLDE